MGQGHSHGHGHGHHNHHHHPRPKPGEAMGRLWLAFALNISFAVIELFGGIATNSVAILSDALHDFGDALAIGLALGLERFSHKKSDSAFSYGYRRYSTMAALITGVVLVCGAIFILVESIPRLLNPQQPEANGMIALAVLGLSVNGFAAWRVSKGASLSERMIMWHLLEDVMGWAIVMIGALVMKFFGFPQIDAILGIVLALWILYNVGRNLREAFRVFLQGVPSEIDVEHLVEHAKTLEGVRDLHHVHVWSLDGEQHIFTGHLVVSKSATMGDVEAIKRRVKQLLVDHQISEATLETESEGEDCFDPAHKPNA